MTKAELIRPLIEQLSGLAEVSAVQMMLAAKTAQLAAVKPIENSQAPVLVDGDELARVLNYPKTWLMSQARQGKIPCIHQGKYVRFNVAEVETALHQSDSATK